MAPLTSAQVLQRQLKHKKNSTKHKENIQNGWEQRLIEIKNETFNFSFLKLKLATKVKVSFIHPEEQTNKNVKSALDTEALWKLQAVVPARFEEM